MNAALETHSSGLFEPTSVLGWVHDEDAATEKTARLVNAARAGLDVDSEPTSIGETVGQSVAVVGDAQLAAAMPESADVTLIADGREFDDVGADLSDVRVERGRVIDVFRSLGDIELTLEARVTDDCIDCMECVRAGPDDAVTRTPVDVDPAATGGEWIDVCPTDAIDLEGVRRTVSFDQVVHPDGEDDAPAGRPATTPTPTSGRSRPSATYSTPIDRRFSTSRWTSVRRVTPDRRVSSLLRRLSPRRGVEARTTRGQLRPFVLSELRACTSSCPTGAVDLADRSNERIAREVEALVDEEPNGGLLDWSSSAAVDPQIVAFVCSERAQTALSRYGQLAASGREEVSYPRSFPFASTVRTRSGRHTSSTRSQRVPTA